MVLLFLVVSCAWILGLRQLGIIRPLLIDSFALTVLCVSLGEQSCRAQAQKASPAGPNQAKALYQQFCQRCHAADGKGDVKTEGLPDFTRRAWHEQKSDAQLIVSILHGKGTVMPAFRSQLSQAKAKELVAYLRAFAPAAPGKQSSTSTSSEDFEVQLQKLQK